MLESKEILLFFKIEGNNKEEKDWLNRNAIWCHIFLFDNFKIIVVILFSPSLLSVGVIKNDSIFKGGR